MEFNLKHVPTEASKWDVTKAIAFVLHEDPGPDWFGSGGIPERPRKWNFQVILGEGHGGVRNNSTGKLMLPSKQLGRKLLDWLFAEPSNHIRVLGKNIRIFSSKEIPDRYTKMTLEKAPYIEPETEEQLQHYEAELDKSLHVDDIQIGTLHPWQGPEPGPRLFTIEFSENYEQRSATLKFEWRHRLIRLTLGNNMMEQVGQHISIYFSSVRKIEIGRDYGKPFVCFDLQTPPIIEEFNFNQTGDWDDATKSRRRVAALNERHALVAPYAHHIRLLLFHETYGTDPLESFIDLCKIACHGGLRIPLITKLRANRTEVSFTRRELSKIRRWVFNLDWDVAFQIELLLHNGHLTTKELLTDLKQPIDDLCRGDMALDVGLILRRFAQALQMPRPRTESVLQCFQRVSKCRIPPPSSMPNGMFSCYHVTVTPTRFHLEGPYVNQSNRVIRRYEGYEQNFLRVDFRDEDRLYLRWIRGADGRSFLRDRVGRILKEGFELAGRRFEFLAYSSSALRGHSVWFLTPFEHIERNGHPIDSHWIRSTLGKFQHTVLIKQPSKYAARLAQAFSATHSSVKITRDQWEEVGDLKAEDGSMFTDGCGTISSELRDQIWQKICPDHSRNALKPDVYQIRFLGYKGVVSVDVNLEGVKMRLRPSMRKFEVRIPELSEIEIAQPFNKPGVCYLNRPFIMILEDRHVPLEVFETLQEAAVAEARTIDDSYQHFRTILRKHGLGVCYNLADTLSSLEVLGLDLKKHHGREALNDPFLSRIRQVAMNHALRDVKHAARIPIPQSWLLVGVADEGPAYKQKPGFEDVLCLKKGQIFACVQSPDEDPTWIKGRCILYRSPAVHPGDVLVVYAIGKPPADQLCLFGHLRNAVVFPSIGERSLASCSGGGDLDGDIYCIIKYPDLLPAKHVEPAKYDSEGVRELDRPSTVDDICDFIVEYIHSDVLGLLSDRHLVIADQSKDGTEDSKCIYLAKLCSCAVDYPKNGIPVNMDGCPKPLIKYKPDWHAAEDSGPNQPDYYVSTRALGHLYRAITIDNTQVDSCDASAQPPMSDPVSERLRPIIMRHVENHAGLDGEYSEIADLFQDYADELQYICNTHTVTPQGRLTEEEVVVGTILTNCGQRRWRSQRIQSMRIHASVVITNVQNNFIPSSDVVPQEELQRGLTKMWLAWKYACERRDEFGANSFGLIALRMILYCLAKLGTLGG